MILTEEENALAQKLTNWQRNQWAKAGYPSDKIQRFLDMTKENRND